MKIGILTFHRANNLGAALQAFALQKYIEDNLYKCDIIDFYPNNSIPKDYKGIKKILRACKRIMMYPFTGKRRERDKKFDDFRKEYNIITKQHYYGDKDIEGKLEEYDVIVSGSDQILNTTLTGNSKAYYLSFFKGKKISYASSFGRYDISSNEIKLIRSELIKFSAISVRERSAAEIIKNEIGKDPKLVLDPVFLLNKKTWSNMCNKALVLPEKYIFVYLMEGSANIERIVKALKDKTGLPILVVLGAGKLRVKDVIKDFSCGPKDFLRYIRDAEYIVTNSFHGIAFSLIFEKKFYCIAHSSRNTRLENILQLINQREKMISSIVDSYDDKLVEKYGDTNILERYIDISKDYLMKNLQYV